MSLVVYLYANNQMIAAHRIFDEKNLAGIQVDKKPDKLIVYNVTTGKSVVLDKNVRLLECRQNSSFQSQD